MKKILITGATGFVGQHLTNLLLEGDYEIHGTSLTSEKSKKKLFIHELDLLDEDATKALIKETRPDWIVHLAALSSPQNSYKNPREFLTNNTNAQLNVLEAVKALELDPRILIISSGEIYGPTDEKELPLDEDAKIHPTSPYAVSKVTQDFLALQYHLSYGMDIVRTRPFNHIGPGQSDDFVVSSFAKQIAEVEKGKTPEVKVGNLESRRDFTDVRDMVKAYLALLEKGECGEVYNIGRGESLQIKFILDTLLGFSDKEISVQKDEKRMRPSDIPNIICDPSKIHNTTGWEAKIPIEKTLRDTLDYWRGIV